MQYLTRSDTCPTAGLILGLAMVAWQSSLAAAEREATIRSPSRYEVVQRQGFLPATAQQNHPGGPTLGFGDVPVEADFEGDPSAVMECRSVALAGGFGRGIEWTAVEAERSDSRWSTAFGVPAGGWYRLEIRWRAGDRVLATASMEPFGVGEVFIVAGQSYAAGYNDELARVDDPAGRVVAYDLKQKTWRVAHDPQPNVANGGTIWPQMGNSLLPLARVPIGFVNVAVGSTASRQWLPEGPLFKNLVEAGTEMGRFRMVLWQQGESDVIEKTSTETYLKNLTSIRAAAVSQWGFEPKWLLAKSTLHPTVYNDPTHEGRIREAIDRLWQLPGFRPGPDTDILGGENRGDLKSLRHFSAIGQHRAGLMWFAAVWNELNRTE